MKIVFLDRMTMGDADLSPIAALGDLVCYESSTAEEALERVGDCDVLLVNKVIVDAGLLDAAPALKLVCVTATGVNNIDLDAAAARGVEVRNAVGYSTSSVAQATFGHILSLLGNAPYYDEFVKNGKYSRGNCFTHLGAPIAELEGRTFGIIGMGNIGSRVASIATAFRCRVIYYSTSGTSHCTLYPSVSLEELLSQSDIVSIHSPLNERTRNLIGKGELALMKPGAILVNAGRGGIVDEAALSQAVDSGQIAGAALDVFSREPLPQDSPLLQTGHPERFRFAPHTAWASSEARARLVAMVAENIKTTLINT